MDQAKAVDLSVPDGRSAALHDDPCQHGHGANGCDRCSVRLFSVCGALTSCELAALDGISQIKSYAAKAALFEQGAETANVFNVTEGVVRLFMLLPDGRRQIVGFALPGDFLGLALMDRYTVSAEAVSAVKVCRFERTTFIEFVDGKPHFLRKLHEFASHELSLAQEQMLLLGRRNAEEKVAAFLFNQQSRYGRIGKLSVTIPLPMGRQDIADYLGLTIETVSRTLTNLARRKLVVIVPDGVRILAPECLRSLAEG